MWRAQVETEIKNVATRVRLRPDCDEPLFLSDQSQLQARRSRNIFFFFANLSCTWVHLK